MKDNTTSPLCETHKSRGCWDTGFQPGEILVMLGAMYVNCHTLKINMVLNVRRNHKAYKGWAEGGEEGMKVEEEGTVAPCPKRSFLCCN